MTLNWEIIIPVITILLGGSGVSVFFFYRERKKTKKLENDAMASVQWKMLFERADATVKEKDDKIEELYKINGELRDENNSLTTENAVLNLLKCEVVECGKRVPPLASLKKRKNEKNEQERMERAGL